MFNKRAVENFIENNKEYALIIASEILNKEINWQSFNGLIGGNNRSFEISATNYSSANEYILAWKNAHSILFKEYGYKTPISTVYKIQKLLEDPFLDEFINNFLARTFLRAK